MSLTGVNHADTSLRYLGYQNAGWEFDGYVRRIRQYTGALSDADRATVVARLAYDHGINITSQVWDDSGVWVDADTWPG